MFHPASLLLTWTGVAIGLQWSPWQWLLPLLLMASLLAFRLAARRSRQLLWRTRWLLLSLLLLFLFATPGEYLPGLVGQLGITREGLAQGGEQIGRLLILLLSLALLHEHLGNQGLMTGLYWLLQPFSWRDVTVVRLMLVLEYVEQKSSVSAWRNWFADEANLPDVVDGATCRLVQQPIAWQDRLLILLLGAGMLVLWGGA
ncbi:MAG: hypothetical protein Q8M20_04955 [Rhodocyclaceae bacterium]|nr:hypothetical protein [Rhodocyclaceae bacterium]MDZ4214110.1 hypothetical protein [Rhodocyclaceae bacterium]